MTACSFAVSAHVCWNWAVRAARTAIPLFILGHTLSTCRSLDMRRLGFIRKFCRAFVQRLGWRMNHEPNIYGTDGDASKGAAVYTPLALALYDLAVLRISNSFVWECDSHVLLDFYNQHISDKHLDIGVGTGYFLDKCRFPSTAPTIALFDLNPHSLARSAKRLRRYNPSCYMGNALHRIDIDMSGFDSISLNYLLHCLPGNLASKSIVFDHVKRLLRDGGG